MKSVITAPLSKEEARDLTSRIDTTQDHHWALLYEAKVRKAWIPLGYKSFGDYVSAELGMKRSQAYNLLKAYMMRNAITNKLPSGMEMPDVGSTALIDIQDDEVDAIANKLAKEQKSNGGLSSETAKRIIKESTGKRLRKKDDVSIKKEIDVPKPEELPPYFQVLWDAISVLEESTPEKDLYRGFDAIVMAYDRLHGLLERLEDSAEAFLAENPDFAS